MQLTTITLISTLAALASATDGIFSIFGNGTITNPTAVTLTVRNGLVTDPPTCSGTFNGSDSALPLSGPIPCEDGYDLSFSWGDATQGIAATYTTPGAEPFTYNVPNNGCSDNVCMFGFEDVFPGKKARGFTA